MFIIEYKKTQQFHIRELIRSFLFDLHQRMVINEHWYVTKMASSVSMGGFWGNFTAIFWIIEYLHWKLIYIWNKISKCIMSQCGMDFQFIPLHIMYSYQHFEPIQHFNGLSRYLLTFQVNDPKIPINLNDFPFLLNLMVQ